MWRLVFPCSLYLQPPANQSHSACITSFVRMKYMIAFSKSYDPTCKPHVPSAQLLECPTSAGLPLANPKLPGEYMDLILWSLIEELTALFCGCLPALWPLLSLIAPRLLSGASSRPLDRSPLARPTDHPHRPKGFLPIRNSRGRPPIHDADIETQIDPFQDVRLEEGIEHRRPEMAYSIRALSGAGFPMLHNEIRIKIVRPFRPSVYRDSTISQAPSLF